MTNMPKMFRMTFVIFNMGYVTGLMTAYFDGYILIPAILALSAVVIVLMYEMIYE